MANTRVEVTKPEEMPKGEHYVIMEFETVNESDGWGGSHTLPRLRYFAYSDQEEWAKDVEIYTRFKPRGDFKFKAFHAKPAEISISVNVGVK